MDEIRTVVSSPVALFAPFGVFSLSGFHSKRQNRTQFCWRVQVWKCRLSLFWRYIQFVVLEKVRLNLRKKIDNFRTPNLLWKEQNWKHYHLKTFCKWNTARRDVDEEKPSDSFAGKIFHLSQKVSTRSFFFSFLGYQAFLARKKKN